MYIESHATIHSEAEDGPVIVGFHLGMNSFHLGVYMYEFLVYFGIIFIIGF